MNYEALIGNLGKTGLEIEKLKIPKTEIREIFLSVNQNPKIYTSSGIRICKDKKISLKDLSEIFAALCEYSVHAYKKEICEGFITAEGGIRIGICGTAIYEGEKISGIKHISALNIRIPHEIKGFSEKIIPFFNDCGILIIGPPCSGKTTLLRDISRKLSEKNKLIIIDERSEIAGTFRGVPGFDIGYSAVMDAFQKSEGMIRAVRAMSPEIIVCDEFGGTEDIKAAIFSMKSGAKIIASIHAFDEEDFIKKDFSEIIVKSGIFEYFVFLNKKCEIYKIKSKREIAL